MSRRVNAFWGLLLVAACCGWPARSLASAPSLLTLQPCRLERTSVEARCGRLEVFENRISRTGRKIVLKVAVVSALASSPQPDPLFVLAGGPGQAATELAYMVMPAFERIRKNRDIVFVDQRGTGSSAPLDCEPAQKDLSLARELSRGQPTEEMRACLKGYKQDVRHYATPTAMEDLDEVRAGLGYERINLWGASYGTRAALVYMRQFPERVRVAVLDGVHPVDRSLPVVLARDGQRALGLLFDDCEKDAACKAAFPELRFRFLETLGRIEKQPIPAKVAHPVSGVMEAVEISKEAYTGAIRGALYSPTSASLLPLILQRASTGDFSALAAQAHELVGGFSKSLSMGMFYSVICSEDAPLASATEMEAQSQGTFSGVGLGKALLEICEGWPRAELPKGFHEPVKSSVPTLLLSGELDPVTPPYAAEQAKKTLSQSYHLTVEGVGHGVTFQGCVSKLVAQVVERGSLTDLDVSCTHAFARPAFVTSFAGPPP